MRLENKRILIISPQKWSKMFISKHHYSIELAKKNNEVFFLNPVHKAKINSVEISRHDQIENLNVVSIGMNLPSWTKFKLPFLYLWCLNRQIRKAISLKITNIDIVWDFDCNHFTKSYDIFDSKLNIFHAVDQGYKEFPKNKKPDLIIAVSKRLLENYSSVQARKIVVNHGLGAVFQRMALRRIDILGDEYVVPKKIKVGYIGNLALPILNREVFSFLVKNNPSIEFHFIGPNQMEIKGEFLEWLENLKSCQNLKLHGAKSQEELAEMIPEYDIFLFNYRKSERYHADNSHKILEYLATGKVIVGSELTEYKETDLFFTAKNDQEYMKLFDEVKSNLMHFNNKEKIRKRINFVLDNTYEKQIHKIACVI